MHELLHEWVDWRGTPVAVDRSSGVIRGVKILGLESRNGRSYPAETLRAAAALYEEAKVNVNHPKGDPSAPRDYQDRLGALRNVAVRPDGLFGDLHFNPKHALAEQLLWDAEHAPENVGLSHNVQARTARRGDRTVVEAILKVQSVDLVADPATTRGLFEARGDAPAALAELTVESLRQHRPDLVQELHQQQAAEMARLEAEIDRLQTLEAARTRRAAIGRLLAEFHLPDPEAADASAQALVGAKFLETLLAAPNDARLRELVEERARLVHGVQTPREPGRPLSREQSRADGASSTDLRTFVASIAGPSRLPPRP